MSEWPVPNERLGGEASFGYTMRPVFHEVLDSCADNLGMTHSEFIHHAADFRILYLAAFQDGDTRMEALHEDGYSRKSMTQVIKEYGPDIPNSDEEKVRIKVGMSTECMQTLMLAAVYEYGKGITDENIEGMTTWDQQKGPLGAAVAESIKLYSARMHAEADGWTFVVSDRMVPEPKTPFKLAHAGTERGASGGQ